MTKIWFIAATLLGFLTVVLGAFGAHALKNTLDVYGKEIYEKAVHYQMFHVLAILAVGILQKQFETAPLNPAGWSFLIGIILFSGSLYILAITGMKWLGAVTPFGGLAFLIGWVWLAYAMLKA